jgi:DNA-binding protein WhiA
MNDIKEIKIEEISFTKEVKEEITLQKREDLNQRKALLSAFIKINGNVLVRNGKLYISIKTENKKTARLIYGEIKKLYPVQIRIIVSEKKKLRIHEDSKVIFIEICDEDRIVLNDLHIYTLEDGFRALPPLRWISDMEMKKAYLSGAFLASGSVNSPITKNYHLEIAVNNNELAEYILRQWKKFELDGKIIKRRAQHVVYIKKCEQIADFLKILNASTSLMKFESVRIQRDQYNSITRIVNCEVSNEQRAMEVAMEQIEKINWFKNKVGLDNLDLPLKQLALLRLEFYESTYNELAKEFERAYGVTISKSGINHRMKKLMETIDSYRKKEL